MFQVVPFLPSHLSESFTSQPGNQYVAGECGRDIFTPSETLYFKVTCGVTNSDQGLFMVYHVCFSLQILLPGLFFELVVLENEQSLSLGPSKR